jgi:hypothetical protein
MGNRSSALSPAPDAVATTPKPKPKPKTKPKPKRTIKKHYTVYNPSVHEMVASVQEFSRAHPYGRCTICDATTHSTIDHDAPLVRNRMRKQSRMQTRSLTRKHKHKARGVSISPFICLDEGMRSAFDKAAFEHAWKQVTDCINAVPGQVPWLFHALTEGGQVIRESDGSARVYRDDWHTQWKGAGCCPHEVKAIARDMATEFITAGVIMRNSVMSMEPLYTTICYAVVRVYLDALEWEDLHKSHAFEQRLDMAGMTGIKTYGERLVGAMMSDETICKRMQLRNYVKRIVDAVRHEGEEGDDEGEE